MCGCASRVQRLADVFHSSCILYCSITSFNCQNTHTHTLYKGKYTVNQYADFIRTEKSWPAFTHCWYGCQLCTPSFHLYNLNLTYDSFVGTSLEEVIPWNAALCGSSRVIATPFLQRKHYCWYFFQSPWSPQQNKYYSIYSPSMCCGEKTKLLTI